MYTCMKCGTRVKKSRVHQQGDIKTHIVCKKCSKGYGTRMLTHNVCMKVDYRVHYIGFNTMEALKNFKHPGFKAFGSVRRDEDGIITQKFLTPRKLEWEEIEEILGMDGVHLREEFKTAIEEVKEAGAINKIPGFGFHNHSSRLWDNMYALDFASFMLQWNRALEGEELEEMEEALAVIL